MNTFLHEDYLKAQLRRAKRFQIAGTLCVVLSFLMSISAGQSYVLVYLAYPFLLVGFPLWTIGRNTQRRLNSTPRVDQMLNNELKGLSNKYSLHHFATAGGKVINHLLVTPVGLVIMETRDTVGLVTCKGTAKGDKWRTRITLFERVTAAKQDIGNPSRDLELSRQAAVQLLEGTGKGKVPVKGLVVFTRNPDLHVDGCSIPAVPLNELKQTVKELQYDMGGERGEGGSVETMLTSDDRRRLNSLLAPSAAPVPPKPAPARR